MSRAGVAPRVAQAALRHASVEMTLQTYTDPKLLDVAGALQALPRILFGSRSSQRPDCEAICGG